MFDTAHCASAAPPVLLRRLHCDRSSEKQKRRRELVKAVPEIIHCSQTADTFEKKKKRADRSSCLSGGPVRWLLNLITEKHLFTHINASKHTRHAGGLKAELWHCVWDERGKLFRLGRFKLGPSVGCSTVINSAPCVGILGKLSASTANGFVKNFQKSIYEHSRCTDLCLNVCFLPIAL